MSKLGSYITSFFSSSSLIDIQRVVPIYNVGTGFTTVHIQKTKTPWKAPADYSGKLQHNGLVDPHETKQYWAREVYSHVVNDNPDVVMYYSENQGATKTGLGHAFYDMFQLAYANHGDVVLRPEDVLCCISQQFSQYVDKNAELLRDLFVEHDGKKELVVDMDDVGINWPVFMDRTVDLITQHTKGDITNLLDADFSSSTPFDHALSSLSVMSSMKSYFEYSFRTCCGIGQVHFTGTRQDWENLRVKVQYLTSRYDREKSEYFTSLKTWGKQLDDILFQFIETYQGRVNVKFWNSVLDLVQTHGSGATTTIHGWMTRFICNKDKIEVSDIPNVNFKIPVKMNLDGAEKDVNIVGGFSGIWVDNTTGLVQCQRSYSVIDLTLSQQSLEKRKMLVQEYKTIMERLEESRKNMDEAYMQLNRKFQVDESMYGEVSPELVKEYDAEDLYSVYTEFTKVNDQLNEEQYTKQQEISRLPISKDDLKAALAHDKEESIQFHHMM